ncbi:unnamed protein product, partial [Scytosiphon promiscuus]
ARSGAADHSDEENLTGDEALLLPIPCGCPFHIINTTSTAAVQAPALTAAPAENCSDASPQAHAFRLDEVDGEGVFFFAEVSSPPGAREISVPSCTSSASQLPKAPGLVAAGGSRNR